MSPFQSLPDFDVLVALHEQDPEALEAFRRHLLRDAVDAAPLEHQETLEQLLLRIESARNAAAGPVDAAVTAFRMMGESVSHLCGAWDQALYAMAGLHSSLIIERVRRS